jgi:hypothetical protein
MRIESVAKNILSNCQNDISPKCQDIILDESIFIFLNQINGCCANNLVYSNARELIVKNRRKGIT